MELILHCKYPSDLGYIYQVSKELAYNCPFN